jgi:hypothetical protein
VDTSSTVRRLLVVYAVLTALLDLVVLLPGNPTFSSGWGLVGAVLVQIVLVWQLARGSVTAWALGLLFAVGGGASVAVIGPPIGATEILFVIACLAQAAVLLTRPLRELVFSPRPTGAASAR